MDSSQINRLRLAASDRYREINNLLTSKEIIGFRESLGVSQLGFANYLKVGEASIKRWETYYIQDASQDDHIRVKCDRKYAEMNFLRLISTYEKEDIFNGMKKFSLELFCFLRKALLKEEPDCSELLGKLHFYVDFLHFKRHKKSLTGIKYLSLRNGPFPYYFHDLVNGKDGCSSFFYNKFDDHEKKTLLDVCNFYQKSGRKEFSAMAQREKGYLETLDGNFISYNLADSLLLN